MQKIIGRYPYSPNNNLILFYMYYVSLSSEKSTFWQQICMQKRAVGRHMPHEAAISKYELMSTAKGQSNDERRQ